jgi:hypothetical protein
MLEGSGEGCWDAGPGASRAVLVAEVLREAAERARGAQLSENGHWARLSRGVTRAPVPRGALAHEAGQGSLPRTQGRCGM